MDTLLKQNISCNEQDAKARDHWELHPGQLCPRCQKGVMDYDGMLDLVCPVCRLSQGSAGFS
jgi:hypothetical protein